MNGCAYDAGEAIEILDNVAFTIGRCSSDLILAVSESGELLLDMPGHGTMSLGTLVDNVETNDSWTDDEWEEWAYRIRESLMNSGVV